MKIEINADKINRIANSKAALVGMLALFVVFAGVNAYLLNDVSEKITGKFLEIKEQARPALIEIVKLVPADCADCYDIERAVAELKKQNVNVTVEKTVPSGNDAAQEIINAYEIESLPALLVSGEVNKTSALASFFSSNGKMIDNSTAAYTKMAPPYYNIASGKILGRVKITSISDSSCAKCTEFSGFMSFLKQSGVSISENKTIEWSSDEGQRLIQQYGIKKVPALLVSEDITEYKDMPQVLGRLNASLKAGWFAIDAFTPPYRETGSRKVIGLATLILLGDSSCSQCYDVSINKQILTKFGVVLGEEKQYDVSSAEGKGLIEKYKIKKAPIIIVSPEGKYYEDFVQVWDSVGTIESDGWFVMRSPEYLGASKDLETGNIVEPPSQGDMSGHH